MKKIILSRILLKGTVQNYCACLHLHSYCEHMNYYPALLLTCIAFLWLFWLKSLKFALQFWSIRISYVGQWHYPIFLGWCFLIFSVSMSKIDLSILNSPSRTWTKTLAWGVLVGMQWYRPDWSWEELILGINIDQLFIHHRHTWLLNRNQCLVIWMARCLFPDIKSWTKTSWPSTQCDFG